MTTKTTTRRKQYIWTGRSVHALKEGVDRDECLRKYPNWKACGKLPCESTLERWNNDGGCEALDGCWVEPDGECEHGLPSWLRAMGMI